MPVPCDAITNVDIDQGRGIAVSFSGGVYTIAADIDFANYAAVTSAIPSPSDGDMAYITGNSFPSGSGLVTPHAASVPAGPGLWVYDNRWTRPWNMPWGVMGAVVGTSAQTGIGTSATDLTNMSVTFTAAANRRLAIHGKAILRQRTSAGIPYLLANVAGADYDYLGGATTTTDNYIIVSGWTEYVTSAAGSLVIKLRAVTTGATIDAPATNPSNWLTVVDLGPSGSPA